MFLQSLPFIKKNPQEGQSNQAYLTLKKWEHAGSTFSFMQLLLPSVLRGWFMLDIVYADQEEYVAWGYNYAWLYGVMHLALNCIWAKQ